MNINGLSSESWKTLVHAAEEGNKQLVLNKTTGELRILDKTFSIEKDFTALNTDDITKITKQLFKKKAKPLESKKEIIVSEHKPEKTLTKLFPQSEGNKENVATENLPAEFNLHVNITMEKNEKNETISLFNMEVSSNIFDEQTLEQLANLEPKDLNKFFNQFIPPVGNLRQLYDVGNLDLNKAVRTLPTPIPTKTEFLKQVYYSFTEMRYEHLVNEKRGASPADRIQRCELFTKRSRIVVNRLMTNYKTVKTADLKKSEEYNNWLTRRSQVSNTIGGIGAEAPSAEESKQAADNWLDADRLVSNLALEKAPLNKETICEIHGVLGKNLPNNGGIAGELRKEDIGAGAKNYIPGPLVEKKMVEFEQWFNIKMVDCQNEGGDPIAFSALAYQRLVSIHPFSDANGRCCRMVMDYVLQFHGYPPAEMTSDTVSVAVFSELEDNDQSNVHPKEAINFVYEGVKKSLETLTTIEKKES